MGFVSNVHGVVKSFLSWRLQPIYDGGKEGRRKEFIAGEVPLRNEETSVEFARAASEHICDDVPNFGGKSLFFVNCTAALSEP